MLKTFKEVTIMNLDWWLRIGPDPWIYEHPVIAGLILGAFLIITIALLISERREAKKGA